MNKLEKRRDSLKNYDTVLFGTTDGAMAKAEYRTKMDALFEKFAGKEGELLKTLVRERATSVLTAHYAKYKPEKGSKVQEMIAAASTSE